MKHLLRALSLIALVLAASLTAYAIYIRYEEYSGMKRTAAEQAESRQRQATKAIEDLNKSEAERQALITDYNILHAECLKGVTAHNGLTLANKQRFAAPTCGTAK